MLRTLVRFCCLLAPSMIHLTRDVESLTGLSTIRAYGIQVCAHAPASFECTPTNLLHRTRP